MKKIIYGGGFFKIWGAHQVHVGLRDYEQALANHINILNNNCSVCIFPEGRKNAENKPLSIKGGVSFLSHKTNIPIIPVSINGAHFMTWRDFLSFRRKVKIIFGKPFFVKDIFSGQVILNSDQDYHKSISSIVMGKIKEL